LPITVTPFDARDTLAVRITGIPPDATLSDAAGPLTVTNGAITLTAAQLAGLTLHAGEVASANLTVTATNTLGASASAAPQTIALTVTPVAPALSAPAQITVGAGQPGALPICVTPFDARDPVSVTITGIPAGATLRATRSPCCRPAKAPSSALPALSN
jgi:hypothetical protein